MIDRRVFMRGLAGGLLTAASAARGSTALALPGADLMALIAPYLAAREQGAVGTVVGRLRGSLTPGRPAPALRGSVGAAPTVLSRLRASAGRYQGGLARLA
jgi:hypothetical protein